MRPLIERAQSDADSPGPATTLGLAVRALLAAQRPEDAWEILAAVMPRSASIRTGVFLPLIAAGRVPPDQILPWLDRAEPYFPAQDAPERTALAQVCVVAAAEGSEHRDALLARADRILVPFVGPDAGANPRALLVRADADRLRGDVNAARALCLRALEIDGTLTAAVEVLARASIGDDEGRKLLSDAAARVSQRTNEPTAWLIVARAHQSAAEGQTGDAAAASLRAALDAYRAAIGLDPRQAEAFVQGAAVAERLGDGPTAQEFYDSALALPALPYRLRLVVQNNAAYSLVSQPSPAPEALRRALSLARETADAAAIPQFLDTLARVQLAMRSRADAIVTYRRALAVEAGHPECLLGLSEILATGTPAEQDEARRLAGRLIGDRGVTPALTVKQSERLTRLRAMLGL
jgi:tetratricopeptide (TPR) repeat protein